MPKKDTQITVRIAEADLAKIQQAAQIIWPGAPVSTAGQIASFAVARAEEILKKKKGEK